MILSAGMRRTFAPAIVLPLILFSSCGDLRNRVLEESFEQLYTIDPTANITVKNGDGAVLVYGSSVNEMQVRAVKRAYSHARLSRIVVNVSSKPGSVSITTAFPPKPKWGFSDRSGTVDYTIVVPATANISALKLSAGEILLDGMRGRTARVRLGEGRLFARNCFANLDLKTQRGNLIISYDWWEDAQFNANANVTHGNAWAYIPPDASFRFVARVAHGLILNDFDNTAVPRASPRAGMNVDAQVNGGGDATIQIGVQEGNIKVVEANP